MATKYYVVSDLHMAGRAPLNDFDEPAAKSFRSFLKTIEKGSVFVLNGDTFDFAQTPNDKEWALLSKGDYRPQTVSGRTVDESKEALGHIIELHEDTLKSVARVSKDSKVWFIAGNHDPDMLIPQTQGMLREQLVEYGGKGKNVYFGHEIVLRPKSKKNRAVRIFHGHQEEGSENRYDVWPEPFVDVDKTQLATTFGDRFMSVIMNPVDLKYPYVDNILPIRRLLRAFWESNRSSKLEIASLLYNRFRDVLSADKDGKKVDHGDELGKLLDDNRGLEAISDRLNGILASGDSPVDAGVIYTYSKETSGQLKETISKFKDTAFSIVGHTHEQEKELLPNDHRYYNTGTWIPYLKQSAEKDPKFHDLPLSAHAKLLPQYYARSQDYLTFNYDEDNGIEGYPKLQTYPVGEDV